MASERPFGETEEELPRLGRELVSQLFVALKTSGHYSLGHSALDAPLSQLLGVIRELHGQRQDASLLFKGDQLYLGGLRVKAGMTNFAAAGFVMELMKRHQVGCLSFGPGVTEDELRRFLPCFGEAPAVSEPYAALLARMHGHLVARIEVEALQDEVERVELPPERLQDGRLRSRLLHRRTIGAVAEVLTEARAGATLRLRECKRLVQQMIDLLPSHEWCLLGQTTRRRQREAEEHAVAVALLSLAIGRRLGLSKFHLCELGLAALLHDLGETELPAALLDKREPLCDEERRQLELHTLYGVRKMMELRGVDAGTAPIICAIFQHHLRADFSGSPGLPYHRLTLIGRIVGVADSYDTLTASRAYGRTPARSDLVLKFLLSQGEAYDRALVKLLVQCVGVLGLGALLRLESGEIAVVLEDTGQLRVKVVADAAGRETDGEIRELQRQPSCTVLDRHRYGIEVSRYFG